VVLESVKKGGTGNGEWHQSLGSKTESSSLGNPCEVRLSVFYFQMRL